MTTITRPFTSAAAAALAGATVLSLTAPAVAGVSAARDREVFQAAVELTASSDITSAINAVGVSWNQAFTNMQDAWSALDAGGGGEFSPQDALTGLLSPVMSGLVAESNFLTESMSSGLGTSDSLLGLVAAQIPLSFLNGFMFGQGAEQLGDWANVFPDGLAGLLSNGTGAAPAGLLSEMSVLLSGGMAADPASAAADPAAGLDMSLGGLLGLLNPNVWFNTLHIGFFLTLLNPFNILAYLGFGDELRDLGLGGLIGIDQSAEGFSLGDLTSGLDLGDLTSGLDLGGVGDGAGDAAAVLADLPVFDLG